MRRKKPRHGPILPTLQRVFGQETALNHKLDLPALQNP